MANQDFENKLEDETNDYLIRPFKFFNMKNNLLDSEQVSTPGLSFNKPKLGV